jgi:hypothetical protein
LPAYCTLPYAWFFVDERYIDGKRRTFSGAGYGLGLRSRAAAGRYVEELARRGIEVTEKVVFRPSGDQ